MTKRFYTIAQLSKKQSLTPEGYLLCEDVPIARTGMMLYGGEELQRDGEPIITPDDDGLVRIYREPEEVFRPETIASFNGKSITDDHPPDGVKPLTWKELTVGIVMNVRRGLGADDDLLLADMLVTTPDAIEAVRAGKREVSCGYDAEYKETVPGEGRQTDIIGNHVALVESGRCGWRCAIGDRKFKQEKQMAAKDDTKGKAKLSWMDRAKAAFFSRDEEEFENAMDEAPSGGTTLHVHSGQEGVKDAVSAEEFKKHVEQNAAEHKTMNDSIEELRKQVNEKTSAQAGGGETGSAEDEKEIEGHLEEEAPTGTGDKARKATDSAYLAESYRDTLAAAEILAPGIRVFSFDHQAKPGLTFKRICNVRKEALDLAYNTAEGRGIISDVLGGKTLDTKHMSCGDARTVFRSASAMRKRLNDSANAGAKSLPNAQTGGGISLHNGGFKSVKDISAAYDKLHNKSSN